jgi:serine/threonine protein kinase
MLPKDMVMPITIDLNSLSNNDPNSTIVAKFLKSTQEKYLDKNIAYQLENGDTIQFSHNLIIAQSKQDQLSSNKKFYVISDSLGKGTFSRAREITKSIEVSPDNSQLAIQPVNDKVAFIKNTTTVQMRREQGNLPAYSHDDTLKIYEKAKNFEHLGVEEPVLHKAMHRGQELREFDDYSLFFVSLENDKDLSLQEAIFEEGLMPPILIKKGDTISIIAETGHPKENFQKIEIDNLSEQSLAKLSKFFDKESSKGDPIHSDDINHDIKEIIKKFHHPQKDAKQIEYDKSVMVMDKMSGKELQNVVTEFHDEKNRSIAELLNLLVLPILNAYQTQIASKGFIHRDIKPENINVVLGSSAKPTEAYFLDIDTAEKIRTGVDNRVVRADGSRSLVGTQGFIAPELMEDRDIQFSQARDIFALGMILAHCLHPNFSITNALGGPFSDALPDKDLNTVTAEVLKEHLEGSYDLDILMAMDTLGVTDETLKESFADSNPDIASKIRSDLINLIKNMTSVNPDVRPSIEEAIKQVEEMSKQLGVQLPSSTTMIAKTMSESPRNLLAPSSAPEDLKQHSVKKVEDGTVEKQKTDAKKENVIVNHNNTPKLRH